jgi:DNA-binding transcriptional regulator YdaS (Cro superfamily)
MEKIILIIEKSADNELWGRVVFDENLITDSAPTLELLQKKMRKLLHDFHDLSPADIQFVLAYDLTAVFDQKKYLNLSEVALKLGINRSLMAQYASGKKFPSPERAKEIEKAIHELGRDLLDIRIAVRRERARAVKSAQPKKKTKVKV